MKLADTLGAYYAHSGKASDVARQLAFAGIAIVWTFKIENAGRQYVAPGLVMPAQLIVSALALDLMQYIVAAAIWGIFNRLQEKKANVSDDTVFRAPWWINWPALVFFWSKLCCIILAYYALLVYLTTYL